MTPDQLCASIGLGGRRRVDLAFSGLKALDVYRLAQIADRLEVSVDWLLGRSDVMEQPQEEKAKNAKRSRRQLTYAPLAPQLLRSALSARREWLSGEPKYS